MRNKTIEPLFEPDSWLLDHEVTHYNDVLLDYSLANDEVELEMLDSVISYYVSLAFERYNDSLERKGGNHEYR